MDAMPDQSPTTSATGDPGAVRHIIDAMGGAIVGQKALLGRLVLCLLGNGHVLLEGVPGLAKTRIVTALAQVLGASFARVQFTPDLLPADLVGTLVLDQASGEFRTRKGPIFAHMVLADEVNRAPAKVQSALLEAMQEGQVTIGEQSHPLPHPFLVLATQNPIEHEGTYPLPEAQMDRFMFKLRLDYPSAAEEREMLDRFAHTRAQAPLGAVASLDDVLAARVEVDALHVDDAVRDYIVRLVGATREPASVGLSLGRHLDFGASPRATLFLAIAARASAWLAGRDYVTPQDVKDVALDVLRHRLLLSFEAEAEGISADALVVELLDSVSVP